MEKVKLMFSMEAAKIMVAAEPKKHKQMMIAHAVCVGICTLIFCALYFARLNSVNILQTRTQNLRDTYGGGDLEVIVYDTYCIAPYSDPVEAAKLAADLFADCDKDCRDAGSRWSHIYASMGFIMLFVCLATICVCIGAFKPMLRCIASCCMTCLCCAHFCTWIAVAVYRFRPQGQICALS